MDTRTVRTKSIFFLLTWVLFGLLVSQGAAFASEPLTYISPWGGIDAEKERRIVKWAVEQTGVDVDLLYPGGVGGVIEQLLLLSASNIPVDIVWNHQSMHHQFNELNAWMDLRPFVERDTRVSFDQFAPGALDFFTDADGRITALPFRWSFTVLNYNVDLFDEAGVAYPNATWTLEGEFLEAARRLTRRNADGETVQWGVAPFRLHEYIWRAWGADLLSADKQSAGLDTLEAYNALQFLRDLYLQHEVAARGQGTWQQGTTAMLFEHPALERTPSEIRWDIAEVPVGPSGTRVTRGAVGAWSIPVWSQNPEAAWQVVGELASYEGQLRYLEEGLGGTRFDSIRHFLLEDYDPQKFVTPLHPDSFQNRDVFLQAMAYAHIDRDRQLLSAYIPELAFSGNTPLGDNGDITRPNRPLSHIVEDLTRKINATLAVHPELFR